MLAPVVQAARESGLEVEITERADLRPEPAASEQWEAIRSFGFAPVWRDPSTDRALREAYWRAWRALSPQDRAQDRAGADRRAWEAAYETIGDDRLYGDATLWTAFFDNNRRTSRFSCAADFAEAQGARLVRATAPRAENAVRFTPARPGLSADRAIISAWAVYPPLAEDGAPRETGTIWLLSPAGERWRVISARRVDY